MDVEKTQQKYETAQQKCLELQTRVSELIERAERAENKSTKATAQLLNSSHNHEEGNKIRVSTTSIILYKYFQYSTSTEELTMF